MIPVGTLCILLRSVYPDHPDVGRECTVVSHAMVFGGLRRPDADDCFIATSSGLWSCLFADLLPLSGDPDAVTRETEVEA